MISLQQGCIRKSDTDSSNNGTFLLLSVTWLQQEPHKFPAIKFWQVAGNQSNMLYSSRIYLTVLGEKNIFNMLTMAGLEHRLPYRQCRVVDRFMLCWGVYKRVITYAIVQTHINMNVLAVHPQACHKQLSGQSFIDF